MDNDNDEVNCCICLEPLSSKPEFTLSCNHQIHYNCFLSCVYKNQGNIFIKCPLCREMNYNNKVNLLPEENLKQLSFFKRKRCCHKTKQGHVCKNKSLLLNYGYCYQHNKNILMKEKYTLLCDYIYYLLDNTNTWKTKIYMADIGKQLLIKYPEISSVEGLMHYFFRYFHYKNYRENNKVFIPVEVYDHYDLKMPSKEWRNTHITNKTLI